MKFKGLSKTKVLRTPEDVLEHSYGRKVETAEEPPPAPEPVPEPEPSELPPDEEEMTEEEYAASLVDENNKDALIEMAEGLELDASGNKADIAARIAAKEYSGE
jgi:hypothetical protein